MPELSLEASVHYDDLRGTVAADWRRGQAELREFAAALGVDVARYHPIGLRLTQTRLGEDEPEESALAILAANREVVGTTDEEVRRYVAAHGGRLPVVVFHVRAGLAELLPRLRRLSLVLLAGATGAAHFELASEIDLAPDG